MAREVCEGVCDDVRGFIGKKGMCCERLYGAMEI